jgi:hypothetical protein
MSNPGDNGAPVDFVNRPAFGYILNFLCVCLSFKFYLSFNLNTCTCFALTGSLITVMNLLIISGIKMYRKLRIYLTTYPWVGLREWLVCELSEQSYIWARVGCVEHLLKHLLLLELLLLDGKLPIVVWQLQEVCNCRSKIVEPSIYWFVDRCGKGADWKRFS